MVIPNIINKKRFGISYSILKTLLMDHGLLLEISLKLYALSRELVNFISLQHKFLTIFKGLQKESWERLLVFLLPMALANILGAC